MDQISTSNRKSLIRRASQLPKGNPERKAILAGLRPGLQDPILFKGQFRWVLKKSTSDSKYVELHVGAAAVRLDRGVSASSWEVTPWLESVFGEDAKIKQYEGYNRGTGHWKKTQADAIDALVEYLEDIKWILKAKAGQVQNAIDFVNKGVPPLRPQEELPRH